LLGEEIELAVPALGGVVCGGFFLRTEVRADVSLVACMLLRLSRRRKVPVRSIIGDEEGEEAVAVIEDARVAVAVGVLAWAAEGLALADIRRHGSALSRLVSQLSQPIRQWGQMEMGPRCNSQCAQANAQARKETR